MFRPLHSHVLDVHTHASSIRIERQHVGMPDVCSSVLLAVVLDVHHLVEVHVSVPIVLLVALVVVHTVQ